MEDFLMGLEEALSSSIPNNPEKKQVHFNSKIIVNHRSFVSETSSVTDSMMMGFSNLNDDEDDGPGI
jgi:hypothetical protein